MYNLDYFRQNEFVSNRYVPCAFFCKGFCNDKTKMFLYLKDFCLGAFWTLFWFFSACAFAAGVNNLKDAANTETLISGPFKTPCSNGIKCTGHDAKYATLTVAIVSYCIALN